MRWHGLAFQKNVLSVKCAVGPWASMSQGLSRLHNIITTFEYVCGKSVLSSRAHGVRMRVWNGAMPTSRPDRAQPSDIFRPDSGGNTYRQ